MDRSCPNTPTADAGHDDYIGGVVDAVQALKRWSIEGPPSNPRAAAGAVATQLQAFVDDRLQQASRIADLNACAEESSNRVASLEVEVSQAQMALKSQEIGSNRLVAKLTVRMAIRGAVLRWRACELEEDIQKGEQALAEQVREVERCHSNIESQKTELANLAQQHSALCLQVRESLPPVSVMCRVRPAGSYSKGHDGKIGIAVDGQEITVEDTGGKTRKFRMDRVLDANVNQEDVFGVAAPWVESVLRGGSACVVAYGATGSGKTYSLQGNDDLVSAAKSTRVTGLSHYALQRIIEGPSGGAVRLTVVEVYCDQIRDLLAVNPDGSGNPPTLQCSRRDAQGLMLLECVEEQVDTFAKAEAVLQRAYAARATDSTFCNERSSRSHIVLTARSETGGHLVLVDLAGSENVHKSGADDGKLLAEAKAINKSLSALADVVEAHAKRQAFVPYRNSRLTMLLEEALSQAKVLLFVHVSPFSGDAAISGHSLQFGGRIRSVDFGAQMLRKDQEQRLKSEHQRTLEANRRLESLLDQLRKEMTDIQKEKKEQKQQIAQFSEQVREQQRELTREKEIRARFEAAGRATGPVASEVRPVAQKEVAQTRDAVNKDIPQRPSRITAQSTSNQPSNQPRRRVPTPPIFNRGPREFARDPPAALVSNGVQVPVNRPSAGTLHGTAPILTPTPLSEVTFPASKPGSPTPIGDLTGPGGRPVFGDVTNTTRVISDDKDFQCSPAKLSPLSPLTSSPRLRSDSPGCLRELRPFCEQIPNSGNCDNMRLVRVRKWDENAPEVCANLPMTRRGRWEDDSPQASPPPRNLFDSAGVEMSPAAKPNACKTALKRIPTNFTARQRRAVDGILDTNAKTVTFSEMSNILTSPPRWYLQYIVDLKEELDREFRQAAVARSENSDHDHTSGSWHRSPPPRRIGEDPTIERTRTPSPSLIGSHHSQRNRRCPTPPAMRQDGANNLRHRKFAMGNGSDALQDDCESRSSRTASFQQVEVGGPRWRG